MNMKNAIRPRPIPVMRPLSGTDEASIEVLRKQRMTVKEIADYLGVGEFQVAERYGRQTDRAIGTVC